MKKIKEFYNGHRIFTILMALVIVCLVLIGTVLIQLFYVGKGTDKYGERLAGIEDHEITSSRIDELKNSLTEELSVNNATIDITGKIVYVKMYCNETADLEEVEGIAYKFLSNFSEEDRKFYDFHFVLQKEQTAETEGFLISGASNKNGTGLSWNNNRQVIIEETIVEE